MAGTQTGAEEGGKEAAPRPRSLLSSREAAQVPSHRVGSHTRGQSNAITQLRSCSAAWLGIAYAMIDSERKPVDTMRCTTDAGGAPSPGRVRVKINLRAEGLGGSCGGSRGGGGGGGRGVHSQIWVHTLGAHVGVRQLRLLGGRVFKPPRGKSINAGQSGVDPLLAVDLPGCALLWRETPLNCLTWARKNASQASLSRDPGMSRSGPQLPSPAARQG